MPPIDMNYNVYNADKSLIIYSRRSSQMQDNLRRKVLHSSLAIIYHFNVTDKIKSLFSCQIHCLIYPPFFLFLHKQKSFKAINFSDLFVYCPLLSSPPKRRVCNFPDLFWAVILTKGGDFWLADVALSLSGVMLPCSDVFPLFCFLCLHAPVLLPSF